MDLRSVPALALASILLMGMASAVSVSTSEDPSGTYAVGDSFIVKATFTFDCADEGTDAADYKATITNLADYPWLNASEEDVSYDPSGCIGLDPLSSTSDEVEINVTVSGIAAAFQDYDLQPGLVGADSNDGGNFSIQQEYDPAFVAPSDLTFDSVMGGATATIPLTTTTNADSTYTFDVTSFTFDGEDAPEGAMAHIPETLDVDTPLADGEDSRLDNVELHFADHGDHEEGDSHDDMAMEDGDHDDDLAMEDGGHMHWETAEVTLSISMAAQADANMTSEAETVTIIFTNTDEETMPHDDDGGNGGDEGDDEGGFFKFLPGYELIAAISALGAVAVLARRRE